MNIMDYHIHSDFSGDCDSPMVEMCAAAARSGIQEICFTEHVDLGDADCPFTVEDPKAYHARIEAVRAEHPGIAIRMGLEMGATNASHSAELELIGQLPLDYLLVSCHLSAGVDPARKTACHGRERDEVVRSYFLSMLEAVNAYERFDALAHIGYVYRYLSRYHRYRPDQRFHLPGDAPDILDEILKRVIAVDAALEINTSTFDELGFTMPVPRVLERYAQLGGEAAVFASDAHFPQHIARHHALAIDLLKQANIRYLASYECRRRMLHKL